WIRALNADENPEEVRVLHCLQQLAVVRDVDRGFGRELEWIVALFLPGFEPRQQGAEVFLVADEIVVDEIDMPAITLIVQRLQFSENLIVGLGTRHATIKLDNVAELAGERAATRILHANEEIVIEIDQIVAGHRA